MADKAIFLDRDDTLIKDPGYINHHSQVKLLDGVAEALIELKHMGYKLIVVSNQSAVARGIVSEKVLGQIHNRLKQLLAEKGASLDRIYYCPYHPNGVIPKYRKKSSWRKPNPGMLLAAADEMDIELDQSWMIGNSESDIGAGLRAGCKTILINHSSPHKQPQQNEPKPDYKGVNIKEAVNIIKKHHRLSDQYTHQDQSDSKFQLSLQATEQLDQPRFSEPGTIPTEQKNFPDNNSEQLLNSILEQLKGIRRNNMFGEFSITRLFAVIVQIIVLFCLLVSIWLLMSPTKQDDSVLIALGFTAVFQIMALTFYIMQRQR